MCEHVWLIPPAALECANWRKKYRIKCKHCGETRTVWGESAQRIVLAKKKAKPQVVAPKPKPPGRRTPVEHDFSDKKQGWGGEYLFGEGAGGTALLASGSEGVEPGDTILLTKGTRYVVKRIAVPSDGENSWVAEMERTLL